MQRTRFAVDFAIDDAQFYLSEDQLERLAREQHSALHTVLVSEFNIPEEQVITNTEPNYTQHKHKQDGSYCNGCVRIAQDGLTSD